MILERLNVGVWLVAICLLGAPFVSAAERPLLMEGKQTLYQRVLSKPGALLADQAGGEASKPTVPFTAYYVYAREQKGNEHWARIGSDSYGDTAGWAREADLIPWNQTLTVSFRDPSQGSRVLLFKDKESLKSLIDRNDDAAIRSLYLEAINGKLGEDSPVVAIQPAEAVDITEDFYLVPIIDHEDVYLGSEAATLLKVTTVPLESAEQLQAREGQAAGNEKTAILDADDSQSEAASKNKATVLEAENREVASGQDERQAAIEKALRDYRSGVMFVIDSTRSMQPYIDRTREAVKQIYQRLDKEGVASGMSFGVVAYRDDPGVVPGLEYRIKTVVGLKAGEQAEHFLSAVDQLKAAEVSSQDFVEDAYAGVVTALDAEGWKDRDARYLVLITDAGARDPGDKLASTGLDAERLNKLAQEKGVVILVLHLLTPQGEQNHEAAEKQYKALSYYPGIGSLYHAVPTGNVEAFGQAVDIVAGQISGQVRNSVAASVPEQQPAATEAVTATTATRVTDQEVRDEERETALQAPTPTAKEDSLASLQAKLRKLGYALRMQYLQAREDGQVPSVFNAWLADRDLLTPERPAVDVRVLLTRDQISDLHDMLRQVIDTFQEGLITPSGFIDSIRKLAATLSRNPEKLGEASSLSEMGFMKEYIEDLPYQSESMTLTLEDWAEWPAKRQIEFINRLENKISYYKALHDHTDLWVSLNGGAIDGQSVFPVELQMLP